MKWLSILVLGFTFSACRPGCDEEGWKVTKCYKFCEDRNSSVSEMSYTHSPSNPRCLCADGMYKVMYVDTAK